MAHQDRGRKHRKRDERRGGPVRIGMHQASRHGDDDERRQSKSQQDAIRRQQWASAPLLLLPSPLWGGVGGGGRERRHTLANTSRAPTPTLPHKGGGRRDRPAKCDSLAPQ